MKEKIYSPPPPFVSVLLSLYRFPQFSIRYMHSKIIFIFSLVLPDHLLLFRPFQGSLASALVSKSSAEPFQCRRRRPWNIFLPISLPCCRHLLIEALKSLLFQRGFDVFRISTLGYSTKRTFDYIVVVVELCWEQQ